MSFLHLAGATVASNEFGMLNSAACACSGGWHSQAQARARTSMATLPRPAVGLPRLLQPVPYETYDLRPSR